MVHFVGALVGFGVISIRSHLWIKIGGLEIGCILTKRFGRCQRPATLCFWGVPAAALLGLSAAAHLRLPAAKHLRLPAAAHLCLPAATRPPGAAPGCLLKAVSSLLTAATSLLTAAAARLAAAGRPAAPGQRLTFRPRPPPAARPRLPTAARSSLTPGAARCRRRPRRSGRPPGKRSPRSGQSWKRPSPTATTGPTTLLISSTAGRR